MRPPRPILLHVLVWLAVLAVAVPVGLLLAWCVVNRWPWPQVLPKAFTTRGLQRLFSGYSGMGRVLVSSILLSLLVGLLATVIATMAARALALYTFAGKALVEGLALLPIAVPATVFAMGSHMLFLRLGLGNTALAVVLGHLIYTLPFAVHMMLEVTRAASQRLEEQARVLGAAPMAAFAHGSLPLIAPGVVSAMAVSFLLSYTQYFLTLLLGGGKVKTLAIVVMPLITGSDRTVSSAYSVLYIASTFLVFLVFQRFAAALARRVGAHLAAL